MATHWEEIQIDGKMVPLKVIYEHRNSVRIAMGKEAVILRFPKSLTPAQLTEHRTRMEDWLRRQYVKKPGLFDRYQQADYQNGDTLRVGQRQYEIRLVEAKRKTSAGKIENGYIFLTLAAGMRPSERSKAIRHLLSRLIAADYLYEITMRVHALNDQFFQRPIKGVKLKYNHSNWGSCSNSGNINLSTRLLFAPPDVIDYVIIHELAHLVEMNHSARFWQQVARVMPEYQEKEDWLKKHGAKCDF